MKENKKERTIYSPMYRYLVSTKKATYWYKVHKYAQVVAVQEARRQEQLTWFHIHQTIITLTTTWRVKLAK